MESEALAPNVSRGVAHCGVGFRSVDDVHFRTFNSVSITGLKSPPLKDGEPYTKIEHAGTPGTGGFRPECWPASPPLFGAEASASKVSPPRFILSETEKTFPFQNFWGLDFSPRVP